MPKPNLGKRARNPDSASSSSPAPKAFRTGISVRSEKNARVAMAIKTSSTGIANDASPNNCRKKSPTYAPKIPMMFLGCCEGPIEFQLGSLGLKVTTLNNSNTAAATSTTASASLACDFLFEDFVRGLLAIAVAHQNITRNLTELLTDNTIDS